MKKTLAELLEECRAQAQKTSDAINRMITESKRLGVVWPELEEKDFDREDYDMVVGDGCENCALLHTKCLVEDNIEFKCFPDKIFVKKQKL